MKCEAFLGFTISELLVAMSIIGIVVAITVPTVVSKYQQKSMLALLKKNYVELQENLLVLSTENNNKSFYKSILSKQGSKSVEETAGEFIKGFYTITNDCEGTAQPCFADSYRTINSSTRTNFSCSDGYNVLLKGGAAMCIIPADSAVEADEEAGVEAKDAIPAHIFIDVNGIDRPNIGGRDLFSFYVYDFYTIDDGKTDNYIGPEKIKDGTAEEARETLFNSSCLTSFDGTGCFGKILNDNWKMNY